MTYLHVDLCCGLGGWQAPFQESPEWRSVGLDIREDLNADVIADVRQLPLSRCEPDLLTMSPPCTEFTRWDVPWFPNDEPDTRLVEACIQAVDELEPTWWVLENVRGCHRYWKSARTHYKAYYLWGEWPPLDVVPEWPGKMETSGEQSEKRAQIPYNLSRAFRVAVEKWG